MTQSILSQVRAEAYREGIGQMAQVAGDEARDAYDRGYRQGRRDGYLAEGRWFRFGVLCGIALSALVWSFWPW